MSQPRDEVMPGSADELLPALDRNGHMAVLYVNGTGQIRYWNDGAESIFGYRADDVIGRPVDVIIPEELRDMHWKGFRSRIGTNWNGLEQWATLPGRHKDGSQVTLRVILVPMDGADGRVAGVMAFFRRPPPAA